MGSSPTSTNSSSSPSSAFQPSAANDVASIVEKSAVAIALEAADNDDDDDDGTIGVDGVVDELDEEEEDAVGRPINDLNTGSLALCFDLPFVAALGRSAVMGAGHSKPVNESIEHRSANASKNGNNESICKLAV